MELSIVMPCLNESATLGSCIKKAKGYLERSGIVGEVIVADNGSTDKSVEIATTLGARVINVQEKGYGHALRAGIEASKGKFIIMGDSDDTYNFSDLDPFVKELQEGADMVVGNRFAGGIAPGAMPFLHKYLGNPVLSFIARLLFRGQTGDYHCGLRGFTKAGYEALNLTSTGMEFASEQIVKACLFGQKIAEVPTTLAPGPEGRTPHLRTWRDGWRHLRFLLMMSPRWLFLYPGMALIILGIVSSALVLTNALDAILPVHLGIHTLLAGFAFLEVGLQVFYFGILVRVLAWHQGWLPPNSLMSKFLEKFHLEWILFCSLAGLVVGLGLCLWAVVLWSSLGFGNLVPEATMRVFIPGVGIFMVSLQTMFFSFVVATLRSRI